MFLVVMNHTAKRCLSTEHPPREKKHPDELRSLPEEPRAEILLLPSERLFMENNVSEGSEASKAGLRRLNSNSIYVVVVFFVVLVHIFLYIQKKKIPHFIVITIRTEQAGKKKNSHVINKNRSLNFACALTLLWKHA